MPDDILAEIHTLIDEMRVERKEYHKRMCTIERTLFGDEPSARRGLCETVRSTRLELRALWCVIGVLIGVVIRSFVGG